MMLKDIFVSLRRNTKVRLVLMAALLTVAWLAARPIWAQVTQGWSEPIKLNLWDADTYPDFPDLAADPYGRLHVVSVRNYQNDNTSGLIYYSRLDDQGWSTPIDVIASPNGNVADVERLVAGQDGSLFLVWTELNSGLYWSYSTAVDATSAQVWKTQQLSSGATEGDFTMDGDKVYLVYVDRNRDIYFQSSPDAGETWSSSELIWSPETDNQATFTVRLARDGNGVLHTAWTENDASLDWNPSGVWYARSLDGGQTWQDTLHIPDEGSFINIGFDVDQNVHLLWNHSVGAEDGRYHAISTDGGETWSKPEVIFPGLSGRTGFPNMVLDSAGQLHQLTSGRGNGLEGGVYHSLWLSNHWSAPELISAPVPEDNNEGPAAAGTTGNHLHVVYRNVFEIGDILYTDFTTDAPYEASEALPPLQSLESNAPMVAVNATPRSDQKQEVIGANSEPIEPARQPQTTTSPPSMTSPSTAVILAILPVVILLAVVALLHRRRA